MNQVVHFLIGISLFLIVTFLYLGLRPIFLLATFALAIFLLDYSILPFLYFYQALQQWIPILVELNILNTILILTRLFRLSTFSFVLFVAISMIRSVTLIYCRYLPIDDSRRLHLERQIHSYSSFFVQQFRTLLHRLHGYFQPTDEKELEKFQLEQIPSTEDIHDETIHRFEQLTNDLSSPMISNIDCSNTSTPPVRRHHQRVLQQSDLEPFSRTPITPANTHSSKGKILHSTINGSYTGPMTRNRTKPGSSSNTLLSPLKTKTANELNFFTAKQDRSHLTLKEN